MSLKKSKISVLAVTAAVACLSTGCGGGGSDSKGASGDGSYKIAMVAGNTDNFYISLGCGMKEEAAKSGSKVNIQTPKLYAPNQQIPLVNAALATNPDVLVINPTDTTALIPVMKQAKDAGVKVIETDSTVTDKSTFLSFIASDNVDGGKLVAKALFDIVDDGSKQAGIALSAAPGQGVQALRVDGFSEGLKATGADLLDTAFVPEDSPTGYASKVQALLQSNDDLSIIFATNERAARGAAQAVKQSGREGEVAIGSYDLQPALLDMVKAGELQAVVAQQPFDMGVQAVQQGIAALKGKKVTKKIVTEQTVVTAKNADTPEAADLAYKTKC